MSAMAYAAPVHRDAMYAPRRHVAAEYTPPMQPAGYGRAARFNPKTADDDALSIIEGAPVTEPVQQPSSSLLSSKRTVSDAGSSANMMDLAGDLAPARSSGSNYYGIAMDWGKKSAPAAPTASMSQQNSYVAPAAPVAVNSGPNPYMQGIDFGQPAQAAPEPAASMIKQNSYLSQISFPKKRGEEPAYNAPSKGANDLTSFSWNEYADVADGRVQVQRPAKTQYIQQEETVDESKIQGMEARFEQSKVQGALSDWLAPMHESSAARKPKADQKQQEPSMPDDPEKIDPMAIDNYNNWAHSGTFQ